MADRQNPCECQARWLSQDERAQRRHPDEDDKNDAKADLP
jgi:hypothetical protein